MRIRRANYNIIAPFYDLLARSFIPSGAWEAAHKEILGHIPSDGVVWVLGTGSGVFLKGYQGKARFISIDPSEKMIRLARKNLWHLDVRFVKLRHDELSFEKLPPPDVIISPFFLQLLETESFLQWHRNLSQHTPNKSWEWLYADFEWPARSLHWFWQGPYLMVMFLFLWILTGKAIFSLRDWKHVFLELGYTCTEVKHYASGLVVLRKFKVG